MIAKGAEDAADAVSGTGGDVSATGNVPERGMSKQRTYKYIGCSR